MKKTFLITLFSIFFITTTVMAADKGRLKIELTDTDLLPMTIDLHITDRNSQEKYTIKMKRLSGYKATIDLPASSYYLESHENDNYQIESKDFDVVLGEVNKIKINTHSSEGKGVVDTVQKLFKKNIITITLIALSTVCLGIIRKKEQDIKRK